VSEELLFGGEIPHVFVKGAIDDDDLQVIDGRDPI
jgi:hypothetical protein